MRRSEIDAIPLEGDVSFRQRAVEPERAALLVIDLQKGEYNAEKRAQNPDHRYLYDRIRDVVIPNGQRLIAACRGAGIEVVYAVIECLTKDGRDRSLDYKISGIFAARGSWEAEVIDELGPGDDDIVIPKTSSSLFNSTNCDYVLRNLGVEYLMVMGMLTDQCVESAVRDGCDRGFLMTLVDDACATYSEQRHRDAVGGFSGYCVNGGGIMYRRGGVKMYHGLRRELVRVVHGRAPRAGRRALRAAGGGPRVGGACGPTRSSGVIRTAAGVVTGSA